MAQKEWSLVCQCACIIIRMRWFFLYRQKFDKTVMIRNGESSIFGQQHMIHLIKCSTGYGGLTSCQSSRNGWMLAPWHKQFLKSITPDKSSQQILGDIKNLWRRMMIIYSWSFCPQKDGKCCTLPPAEWIWVKSFIDMKYWENTFFSEKLFILFFPPTCKNPHWFSRPWEKLFFLFKQSVHQLIKKSRLVKA
jgi:hypothetical protein